MITVVTMTMITSNVPELKSDYRVFVPFYGFQEEVHSQLMNIK